MPPTAGSAGAGANAGGGSGGADTGSGGSGAGAPGEGGEAGLAGTSGGGNEAGAGGEPGTPNFDLSCPDGMVRVVVLGRTVDESVEFELERCMSEVCGGGCAVDAVYFRITFEGRTDEAWDDDLDYTRTHHNWGDSLTATLPDRTLRWRVNVNDNYVAIDATDASPILEELLVPAEIDYFL
jgi:hypothetical protein